MINTDILFNDDLTHEEIANLIIMNGASTSYQDRMRIKQCRDLYNNDREDDEFDAATRPHVKNVQDECGNITTKTWVMPAKIRHIPLVKTYIRTLLSEERDRPLVLSAYTTDADSAFKREDLILKSINSIEETRFINKISALQLQQQAIGLQKQMAEQQMQQSQGEQDPNNPQPQQDPNQMAQMKMQLDAHLDSLAQTIEHETSVTRKERDAVQKYYYQDYKTANEQFGELVCSFTVSEQRSRNMLSRGFEDRLVTGKEIFHVDYLPGMKDPIHRRVFPENVYFPKNEYVDFAHQHQWSVEINHMTYDNLLAEFGTYVTPKKRKEIQKEIGWNIGQNGYEQTNFLPDGTFVGNGASSKMGTMTNLGLMVQRVYWKRDERIPILIRKKKDRPDFVTILKQVDADKLLDNEKELKKRNERIEYRYVERLYSAVKVGKNCFLFAGEHPVQLRFESDKTSVGLPYIAHVDTPYYRQESLVWETKDLQETYDLLWYQRELLWMLAGVRGMVYDLSQKPRGMDIEDILFYRRQGTMFIESVGENGKPVQFNQFQQFDDTVSPSIRHVEESLMQIQNNISFIIGMSDPRMGVVKPTDQVGTSQLSYNQSSLITEKFFQDHEELTEMVFTRIVNLAKISYEDGMDRGMLVTGDNVYKRVFIPKNGLDGDYKITMKSGRHQSKIMEDYKGVAKQNFIRGAMPASVYVETMSTTSFSELKQLIKSHEELSMKMQQQGVENQQAHEKEIEQMKAELTMQKDATLEKLKGEREQVKTQMEAQLAQQKLQFEQQKNNTEAQLWSKDIDQKSADNKYAVDKDFQIEMAYLLQQQKEAQIQDRNNKTAMLLNTISTELKLGKAKEKVHD